MSVSSMQRFLLVMTASQLQICSSRQDLNMGIPVQRVFRAPQLAEHDRHHKQFQLLRLVPLHEVFLFQAECTSNCCPLWQVSAVESSSYEWLASTTKMF